MYTALKSPLWILPLWLAVNGSALSAEQDTDRNKATAYWSLQLENDVLSRSGDRQYTQGVELSYVEAAQPPGWMNWLAEQFPFFEAGSETWVTYNVGHAIFTPDDLTQTALIPDDRPYAGWLYATHAYVSQDTLDHDAYHLNVLEASVGVVGPLSGAQYIQEFIHKLLPRAVDPAGWSNQLNNEIGLQLNYVHRWLFFYDSDTWLGYELAPHVSLSLGNVYTYVGAGLMFRMGKALKHDIGPPNIRPGFIGSAYLSEQPYRSWYLFVGMESRRVFRNLFLDGNTWSDSHRVVKEPVVSDLQLGFAFHVDHIRLAYSQTYRSKEFTTQSRIAPYLWCT